MDLPHARQAGGFLRPGGPGKWGRPISSNEATKGDRVHEMRTMRRKCQSLISFCTRAAPVASLPSRCRGAPLNASRVQLRGQSRDNRSVAAGINRDAAFCWISSRPTSH